MHTLERLEKEVLDVKEEINTKSEELDIRQRCLQEFQMLLVGIRYVYVDYC